MIYTVLPHFSGNFAAQNFGLTNQYHTPQQKSRIAAKTGHGMQAEGPPLRHAASQVINISTRGFWDGKMAYVTEKMVPTKGGKRKKKYLAKWKQDGKTKEKAFDMKRDAKSSCR
ncbi:hypothetical protein [Sulfitobacter dubius]|uniref:hypothetical protein n=1 Tax=Sulfitobacter dubius TaxID=218673 RepID=UPI0029427DA6|nr:hypothetical protein [Sulfitobacter dubius]WOI29132.1 hypothetical protein R1T39_15845 [Sulfitobacter dubius]